MVWTQLGAAVAGVADRELQIVLSAAVTDCGDAARQGCLGTLQPGQHQVPGVHRFSHGSGVALATETEMDMAVDQARHHGAALGVNPLSAENSRTPQRERSV